MSEEVKTSAEKKLKEDISLSKLIDGANWVAVIVVGLATAMLLFVTAKAIWSNSENSAPKQINIQYTLQVDSAELKAYQDSTNIIYEQLIRANNRKVIEEVNNSVKQQYLRMESILTVQEDKSKLFTYGAGFLTILVALATFFGFKSINEMKKGTINSAEYESKKIAEETAKKVSEEISKVVAEERTKKEIQERYLALEKVILEKVKADLFEDFKRNNATLKGLDDKLANLEKRLDKYFDSPEMIGDMSGPEINSPESNPSLASEVKEEQKDLFLDEDNNVNEDNYENH